MPCRSSFTPLIVEETRLGALGNALYVELHAAGTRLAGDSMCREGVKYLQVQ